MKFSIITPTILRPSLVACIESVTRQTHQDWEHLIRIDRNADAPSLPSADERRIYSLCMDEHHNFGNTCRHDVWVHATGDYLVMLDDDNVLAYPDVLRDLATALEFMAFPDWAIFPIMRHGHRFFNDPPGLCMTDTANVVVKREIGRWPDMPDYTADGHWVEALKREHPNYASFPNVAPIVVMETSGRGE